MNQEINDDITIISVGNTFDLYNNPGGGDGAVLEFSPEGYWFLVIYLCNFGKRDERNVARGAKIYEVNEGNGMIRFIAVFGELALEIHFDTSLYTKEQIGLMMKTNLVQVYGVDAITNIVKTISMYNMPKKMHFNILAQRAYTEQIQDFSVKFNRWTNDLVNRYTQEQLLKMSTYIGRFGER